VPEFPGIVAIGRDSKMFADIADSAITVITSAVTGAGPAVISVVGIIVGVGLVVALLKKAR